MQTAHVYSKSGVQLNNASNIYNCATFSSKVTTQPFALSINNEH